MRTLETGEIRAGRVADGAAYDLHVPSTYHGSRTFRLLVSVLPVHPSIPRCRALELFRDFATAHQYLVLAPQFDFTSGFQFLGLGTPVRHDRCLLQMVDDVARSYAVETVQFCLFGYSAGGQFAHRFLYLHRERLQAVAIGAPGSVTLPGTAERWPAGLAELAELTGEDCHLTTGRWPRILLLVGDQDVTSEWLSQSEEANRFGRTRVERARTLHAAWLTEAIPHTYVEVPGMGHADILTQDRPMKVVWQSLGTRRGPHSAQRMA